ncbi:MAG: DUF6353 family protein [Syntrophales bacterium]|nr:DUF6353 family protein [Syntrophales bacterium]
MKLEVIKSTIIRTAGRSGLLLRKHSPEILMGVGVIGVVTSAVMACRSTLKAEEVIDEAKKKIDKIHYAKETISVEEYTEQDYKKDLAVAYVQTGIDFVRLYGPAVLVGVASIGCLVGSHNIMRKRNIALVAAYKAVEQSFSDYRKRVVAELGEDKDYQFKHGIKTEVVDGVEIGEDGKKKKTKNVVTTMDPNGISQYARFFDESCVQWSKTPEYNLMFLKCQQNHANDLLHSRGHIFLNEVYDMLGIPRTQEGAVVGWVKGEGDDFVDFGIFDGNDTKKRDFVNGYERSILLDFNVAGVIYNMI